MLDVKNLSISIFDSKFVENLSFSLKEGEKLAIIGEEGNGKSTLAKALCFGSLPYATVSGQINLYGGRIGYFEQLTDPRFFEDTVLSYILKDSPEGDEDFSLLENYGELMTWLSRFGFDESILERKIKSLSGGECVKIRLVRLLLRSPDILVLDEPTNDLDLSSLVWLEEFIKGEKRTIIFISHDETLLENCATAILHLERLKKRRECKATFEKVGYGEYTKRRADLFDRQTEIFNKQNENMKKKEARWREIYEKVNKSLNSISRRDPSGGRLLKKKMASVKAQQRRLENQRQSIADQPSQEEAIFVKFSGGGLPTSRMLLNEENMDLKIENRYLARYINFSLRGQEKVAIVGGNGAGKTTLLKALLQKLEKKNISVGYMPQTYDDILSGYKNVVDFAFENAPSKEDKTRLLTFLGSLKFTRDEVMGEVSALSGGQKAKLFLAVLMFKKSDVLVLDEPTRNLSPLSCPVIRSALSDYAGAIICVTHDRKLLEIFDRVLCLSKNGLE